MANTYSNVPVLSKIKLGSQIYYVKDADVRALLDTYGNVVTKDVALAIADGDSGLATGALVRSAIDSAVAGLAGAMHFKGGVTTKPTDLSSYENGDVIVVTSGEDQGKEYVILVDGENKSLIELGDETGHVLKTMTIAGIDLEDDITAAELKSALALKALAFVDTASTTVTDYATGITGAAYTPAGSVSVSLKDAETASTITSTGNVTPTGAVILAAATDSDTSKIQVKGTNADSAVTITATTATTSHLKTAGAAPALNDDGSYTAPTLATAATGNFNTDGIKAHIGVEANSEDTECLYFEAAATGAAITEQASFANSGSVSFPTLNAGSQPVFEDVAAWTGYSAATAAGQTFTGDYLKASFAGDSNSVSVSGSYNKQEIDTASFSGTEATITPTLVTGNKTITVGV